MRAFLYFTNFLFTLCLCKSGATRGWTSTLHDISLKNSAAISECMGHETDNMACIHFCHIVRKINVNPSYFFIFITSIIVVIRSHNGYPYGGSPNSQKNIFEKLYYRNCMLSTRTCKHVLLYI